MRRLPPFDDKTPSSTTFDQQDRIVNEQINFVHLYQIYQFAPGHAELTGEKFQKILLGYQAWVRREYGYTRLHGLQTLQDTGAGQTLVRASIPTLPFVTARRWSMVWWRVRFYLKKLSVDKLWIVQLKDDLTRYGLKAWLDKDEICTIL